MTNVKSSNGLFVSFRCRYRTTNYFDVFAPRGASREIAKHDDGRLTVGEWGEGVTDEERQAVADYEAEELRRYDDWKERNPHLFV